jgi:hypothetical protein
MAGDPVVFTNKVRRGNFDVRDLYSEGALGIKIAL